MTKAPWPFRLLATVLRDLAGQVPSFSLSLAPPPARGLAEGSRGLHPHRLNRVDLERRRRKNSPTPEMAGTRGHTHTRESMKVSNNRNPSYRPGQLVPARQASPPAASPA